MIDLSDKILSREEIDNFQEAAAEEAACTDYTIPSLEDIPEEPKPAQKARVYESRIEQELEARILDIISIAHAAERYGLTDVTERSHVGQGDYLVYKDQNDVLYFFYRINTKQEAAKYKLGLCTKASGPQHIK